ncbi:hypothetical protein HYW19_01215 [Candidatus Woesearchaeota archaeon]|nr:hypothetical protein [Candidatus Woesearchaeota archaeon]
MAYLIEQLDILIIEGSMIGLGLVVALYTLTVPLLDEILKRREEEVKEKQDNYKNEIQKHLNAEFSIKEKDRFLKELRKRGDEVDRVFYKPAFLPILMMMSLALFSLPLLTYFLGYFGLDVQENKGDIFLIFLLGILFFVGLAIYIFFRLYVSQLKQFSIEMKKAKKENEEDVKEVEQIGIKV